MAYLLVTGLLLIGVVSPVMLLDVLRDDSMVDVQEGDNAVLRCSFDPALVTDDSSFYWSQRNIHGWDNVAIRDNKFNRRYRVELDVGSGRYDLHISSATYNKDNGEYACIVRQVDTGDLLHSQPVTLTVLKEPGAPSISGGSMALIEGVPVELVCSSSGGSPAPEIRWYRGDVRLDAELEAARDRAHNTSSTLTLTASREHDQTQLQCVVWNRAMKPATRLSDSILLNVNYYPRISFRPSADVSVEEGGSVELRCDVDAKPSVPNVRWIRNGKYVSTSSLYSLEQLQPSDAGLYTCSAENQVGETKQQLQLQVLYGPRVSVQQQREVPLGASVQLSCQVDASPPAESVHWERADQPGVPLSDSGVLQLSDVTAAHSALYLCVARNQLLAEGWQQPEQRLGNASTRLLVRHAPGAAVPQLLQSAAVEGREMTLSCVAEPAGHPTPTYRWWRTDQSGQRLASSAVNYTVSSVRARHQGSYLCQAENELGAGAVGETHVQVLRAPQFGIRNQPDVTRSTSTADFQLSCSAVGRPAPAISWRKNGRDVLQLPELYQLQTERQTVEDGVEVRSSLQFHGASRLNSRLQAADRGNYTCSFSNPADTIHATTLLTIKHAPIVYHKYSRVAFDIGEQAVIECQMQAFPSVEFHWSFDGLSVGSRPDGLYNATSSYLGNDVHMSSLVVNAVGRQHYGEYVCEARNAEGQRSTELKLQPKSGPQPPSRLHTQLLSTSWSLLDWQPGFNGGYSDTEYQVSVLDPLNQQSTVDCHTQRPCNITGLQHQTTYRLKVRAQNGRGFSDFSDQLQLTTWPDMVQLPRPQRVQFEPESRQLLFHAASTPAGVVAVVETRSDDQEWIRSDGSVEISNNRGLTSLDERMGSVQQLRVMFCIQDNLTICGDPVLAQRVAAGSMLAPAAATSVTTIVIIVVVTVVSAAVLLLLFICCCRRNTNSHKHDKQEELDSRTSLPTYYPPTVTPGEGKPYYPTAVAPGEGKPYYPTAVAPGEGKPTSASSTAPGVVDKGIYSSRYQQQQQQPAVVNMAYNMDNSYSNSNNGGSVNSQDSLWHVKSVRPGHSLDPANYDPAQANYQPDTADPAAGYPDYGYYPQQQNTYPQHQNTYPQHQNTYPQHQNTYPQYSNDTGVPYHNDTGVSYHNDTGVPYHNDTGMSYHNDTGVPYHADTGVPYHNDTGVPYQNYQPHPNGNGYGESAAYPVVESRRPGMSFDESLESGLSTPTSKQRRVIREVVV